MKKCSTCLKEKTFSDFYKRSNRKSGYQSQCKTCCRKWVVTNKVYINQYKALYQQDINYKTIKILRVRLNVAIKNSLKTGSAVKDLGCSINKLKIYLQLQFHRNPRGKHEYMTWDNWSRMGWHIDHIKPLSSFDLTDPKQLKEACHYTNLQPMWSRENLIKSDK